MFEKDSYIKYQALNMWTNYIETGDATLSRNDAIRCGTPEKIQILNNEQLNFIVRLRKLTDKELN